MRAMTRTQARYVLGAIVVASVLPLVLDLVSGPSWWTVAGTGLVNGTSLVVFRRPKRRR